MPELVVSNRRPEHEPIKVGEILVPNLFHPIRHRLFPKIEETLTWSLAQDLGVSRVQSLQSRCGKQSAFMIGRGRHSTVLCSDPGRCFSGDGASYSMS
jgi:hypothetical protein